MSIKQICETQRGLTGQECPCGNYEVDMNVGIWQNFYARLQVAADAGCLNAMCVVANKFQSIHCVTKFVEVEDQTCVVCGKPFVPVCDGNHICSPECYQRNADKEEEELMLREAEVDLPLYDDNETCEDLF